LDRMTMHKLEFEHHNNIVNTHAQLFRDYLTYGFRHRFL